MLLVAVYQSLTWSEEGFLQSSRIPSAVRFLRNYLHVQPIIPEVLVFVLSGLLASPMQVKHVQSDF